MTDTTLDRLDRVRRAWAHALDVPDVPDDVPFFEAGGDSLLLIVLLDELNESADGRLEAADLFQHTTVRAQAALIRDLAGAGRRADPVTTVGPRDRGALLGLARRGGDAS